MKFFLTFANTDFMNTNRISEDARSLNIFDEIIQLNETHISDFINKHKQFINNHYRHGYGYFIWKPKIILDTLMKINDDDILVYCDAGVYLNNNGIERLKFYFEKLNNYDICVFSTNDKYKIKQYVKMDAIMHYYPDFNHLHQDKNLIYAGIMILKKTANVINLITDWLNLCENYNFLDINKSKIYNEASYFAGNDKDNGLFNLCLLKYNNFYKVYPDKINLYDTQGNQLHHTSINFNTINWDVLKDEPFQCRRITPKFFPHNK